MDLHDLLKPFIFSDMSFRISTFLFSSLLLSGLLRFAR